MSVLPPQEYLAENASTLLAGGGALMEVGCGTGVVGATAAAVAQPPLRALVYVDSCASLEPA